MTQENWTCYHCQVENAPAIVCVDLALADDAPSGEAATLAWVRLWFTMPDENGFMAEDEFDRITDIEEALLIGIDDLSATRFVGRATFGGHCDFFFYGPEGSAIESRLTTAMAGFPDYQYDVGSRDDPEWKTYFDFLFPSKREHQTIVNRQVVEILEEEGDRHEIPRKVSHWIYFDSADDRSRFQAEATAQGFSIEEAIEQDEPEEDGENRFGITVSSTIPADIETIDQVVLQLFDLAERHQGVYDGWETSLEKPDP